MPSATNTVSVRADLKAAQRQRDKYDDLSTNTKPGLTVVYGSLNLDVPPPEPVSNLESPKEMGDWILQRLEECPPLPDAFVSRDLVRATRPVCAAWKQNRPKFIERVRLLSFEFGFAHVCPVFFDRQVILTPSDRSGSTLLNFSAIIPSTFYPQTRSEGDDSEGDVSPVLVPLFMPWKVKGQEWAYFGTYSVWPMGPIDKDVWRSDAFRKVQGDVKGLARCWSGWSTVHIKKVKRSNRPPGQSVEVMAAGFRFEGYDPRIAAAFEKK